ncbi:MAG: FKBP-type peptidyl-prolyl cis-trans isomerase [Niabella sp.]
MKRLHILSLLVCTALAFVGCKDANYKTTASGLKYKLIDGGSKDSTKEGDVLKMQVTQKVSGSKDTVLINTYGKMPAFVKVQAPPPGQPVYGPDEVFKMLKQGDSLVTVLFVDSLIAKGLAQEAQLPPFLKKGDKITFTFKVIKVFTVDSLAQADYQKEMELDAPRQQKEQEEMMKKMQAEHEAAMKKEEDSLRKAGAVAKMEKEMSDYLQGKGIVATKTAVGTFVKIDNPGTGAQVADGKFVTVKYTGKKMLADSTFESNSFTMPIGQGGSIKGFEDGLKQFKEGGKGTIYIPGYLAYGKNHAPIFKDYEALSFAVEITKVSDTQEQPQAPGAPQPAH